MQNVGLIQEGISLRVYRAWIKKMDTSATGFVGVQYCDKLSGIEKQIAELSVQGKLAEREKLSKPEIEYFFEWADHTLEKMILNKKLKEALFYVKNQKEELSAFLKDGQIPFSNSLAERSIRPFAVHRKNWLFADSQDGAKANAVFYLIIGSAKRDKLNINKYLNYLLEELPQIEDIQDETVLEKYVPWSEKLPDDIRNYITEYPELKMAE